MEREKIKEGRVCERGMERHTESHTDRTTEKEITIDNRRVEERER